MPIRPENRSRYPEDWPQIALDRKARAGWRCECTGECGTAHDERCPERHGELTVLGSACHTIILTLAHLNHRPEDCRDENMVVMCQGCHLRYDVEHHRASRLAARRCALEGAGQLTMELAA